jgi:hypothetical protein
VGDDDGYRSNALASSTLGDCAGFDDGGGGGDNGGVLGATVNIKMGAIAKGTGAEGLTKVFLLMHRDDLASTRWGGVV